MLILGYLDGLTSVEIAERLSWMIAVRRPRTVSLGTDFHPRNSPALVNSSYYRWTNWGGRFSPQWEPPLPVSENPVTMNGNRLAIVRIASAYGADPTTGYPGDPGELFG